LNFSVECDRTKCKERVGKNGIENGLKVWILCAKQWKWKIENIYAVRRARPCSLHALPCVLSELQFLCFWAFFTFSVLNWCLVWTWKF